MTSCVVIATVAENKMASRKAKKEKLVNKTPEVAQVEDQLKEKELIPGKGFYESHWWVEPSHWYLQLIVMVAG